MKIGYVSQANPFTDRKAWSGLIYKIRESIENAGFEVEWVRITPPNGLLKIIKAFLKLRYGFTIHHPWIFRALAKYTDWKAASDCNMLFFPGGAQIMKYSPIKKPFIYYTDACFNQMVDYYWDNMNKSLVRLANQEEEWAIKNSILNIRSSEWAKNDAINFYGDNPEKNFVLEFGANLDDKDIHESQIYRGGQLNILFSGVDWERKGGDIAVNAVKILREKHHVDAILMIAGIRELPTYVSELGFVKNFGFLNKNIPEQYDTYIDIIKRSNIFLLPTKAECAGIVFCEASAFGLPIYTYDTGGIGNYVINGQNGYRLNIKSTAEDFAAKIYTSITSGELPTLHDGALSLYTERLNWNSWSERFQTLINNMSPRTNK